MSETATVTPIRLPMGAPVPEWLIVAEPAQPNAARGNFRFAFDVEIIETPNYFVVVPQVLGPHGPCIDMTGTMHHRIYSPGKPARVIVSDEMFMPLEVSAWHEPAPGNWSTGPTPGEQAGAEGARLIQIAVEDAKRIKGLNFWQRLKWAVLGR